MTAGLSRQRAWWLGGIAVTALILGSVGLFAIGDRERLWHRQAIVTVLMPSAGGVDVGTRVRVQGINAGQVEELVQPPERGKEVVIRLRLEERFLKLLGKDARAEVMTEGLVGAKVVEIFPGTPEAGPFVPGTALPGRAENLMADLRELALKSQAVLEDVRQVGQTTRQIGERGGKLLDELSALSVQTKSAIAEAELLTRNLREGEGTLGREVVGTLRQLQQTGQTINQSIESLKNMPLVGKYLDNTTKLLVRPNYFRQAATFREDELFPPGRALFTPEGLVRLNDWAAKELPKAKDKGAEIVIVAYQGTATDGQAADILTQRQAEAVRTYLIDHHKIDRLGWFSSRTVQAVGMGNRPAPGEAVVPAPPANRIELIIFAPPGA